MGTAVRGKTMCYKLPVSNDWVEYLEDRVLQAKEINILGEDFLFLPENALIFIPDWLGVDMLTSISPKLSFSDIENNDKPSGWVKRSDMFDEAAAWIAEKEGTGRLELICEAGYSKISDKVLQERPHIIFNDIPLLNLSLSPVCSEKIAQVLRWGRSWRLLGAIVNEFNNVCLDNMQFDVKYFLCDVFDGDSIVLLKSN